MCDNAIMACLHYNHSVAIRGSRKEHNFSFTKQRTRPKKNQGLVVHCCSSSSASADQQVISLGSEKRDPYGARDKAQLDYLVSDVSWRVRRMVETEDEMRRVASVQAEAFHEPVFVFNDLFLDFFKAEVLSGLLYRMRSSPPDRYACLVAVPRSDSGESEKEIVGVVDVTVQNEADALKHLPGMEEYLYVSGIAVLNKFRRQKVATALLKACDMLSAIWGFEYLALRAYEDDYGAQKLYSNAGYRVVSGDPPWLSSWIGRRRRVLMVKRADVR